jgi:hypothetical protein
MRPSALRSTSQLNAYKRPLGTKLGTVRPCCSFSGAARASNCFPARHRSQQSDVVREVRHVSMHGQVFRSRVANFENNKTWKKHHKLLLFAELRKFEAAFLWSEKSYSQKDCGGTIALRTLVVSVMGMLQQLALMRCRILSGYETSLSDPRWLAFLLWAGGCTGVGVRIRYSEQWRSPPDRRPMGSCLLPHSHLGRSLRRQRER